MSTMATITVSLKLLVDMKNNRVVFAESCKDFVEILFSFLTLPMGTVVRLLNKQSSVGCIDNLYGSVENLDTSYLETEACKTMLLQPRSAAERLCEDLLINADDLKPRRLYRCPSFDCLTKTHKTFSSIIGARCPCGKAMDKSFEWIRKKADSKVDVFLKGEMKYIISDDLSVAPATISNTLSLLQKLNIDEDDIEKLNIDLRREEVLILLKRLLLSSTPLTDLFLRKMDLLNNDAQHIDQEHKSQIKLEADVHETTQGKEIAMKLLQNKFSKKVVYTEMRENSVDVLLSFLSFPLGTIVKLLDKQSAIGCLDNLYKSVEVMPGDFIKSEEVKDMLLNPKLFSHFNCSSQMLPVKDKLYNTCRVHGCEACWMDGIPLPDKKCKHYIDVVSTTEVNPKLPNFRTECGGGFAKRSTTFMVTDQLVVTPHSPISGLDIIKELKQSICNLVETEITLGVTEVLKLLKGCLVSQNVLNYTFSPKKLRRLH